MIKIRKAADRGKVHIDWLDSRHSFSFGEYYDRAYMGSGPLRVINEDTVQPGAGFPPHGHRDMEIISYVLSGALEHKDSIGTGSVIRPGDVQRMSAGSGIQHSEFNHSRDDIVHFLQIWIMPDRGGINPSYEQKTFSQDDKRGRLALVASADGRQGSVTIHQDVDVYAGLFNENESARLTLREGRSAWVQMAKGSARINGQALAQGDGAEVSLSDQIDITDGANAEILVFDLPPWPQAA